MQLGRKIATGYAADPEADETAPAPEMSTEIPEPAEHVEHVEQPVRV